MRAYITQTIADWRANVAQIVDDTTNDWLKSEWGYLPVITQNCRQNFNIMSSRTWAWVLQSGGGQQTLEGFHRTSRRTNSAPSCIKNSSLIQLQVGIDDSSSMTARSSSRSKLDVEFAQLVEDQWLMTSMQVCLPSHFEDPTPLPHHTIQNAIQIFHIDHWKPSDLDTWWSRSSVHLWHHARIGQVPHCRSWW